MGKLHRTNAGYLGVSMEETQDPFWSYNKLALPLSQGETVAGSNGGLPVYNTTDAFGTTKGSGTRADTFSSSIALAIAMDGANGGTTFTDESATIKGSGSAKSITRTGTVTSTAQSKYYGSSGYFDGSSSLAIGSSSDFSFTGDFTWEVWIHPTSNSIGAHSRVFEFSNTLWALYIYPASNNYAVYAQLGNQSIAANYAYRENQWTHLAIVKSGSTVSLYSNGVLMASASNSQTVSGPLSLTVNGDAPGSYRWPGYIQDLRIYTGAKYTSSFIIPESGPSTFDRSPSRKAVSNAGATWQTSVSKFYGGAAQFGSSRVITLGSSEDFNFGTGDFTIEYWLYRTSLGSNDAAVTNYSQVSSGYLICLHSNSTDVFLFLNGSSVTSGGVAQANVWSHYAFVRNGTTCTIYKNGSPIASATSSAQAGSTNVMNIGAYSDGTSAITGHIQDVRFYKGAAKYTSSFTPPARSLVQTARRYPAGMHVLS